VQGIVDELPVFFILFLWISFAVVVIASRAGSTQLGGVVNKSASFYWPLHASTQEIQGRRAASGNCGCHFLWAPKLKSI
jgi:hypothetical protein